MKILYTSLLFLLLAGCQQANKIQKITKAQKGTLDLRNWNFAKDGTAKLNGEWEFQWKKFCEPETLTIAPTCWQNSKYIQTPSSWNHFQESGKPVGGKGYATYRLKIQLDTLPTHASLKVQWLYTAHKLWVNGVLIGKSGTVSKQESDSQPGQRPVIYDISKSIQKNTTIVIQMSNYHHKRGGMVTEIALGENSQTNQQKNTKENITFFLSGSTLIMGLYHVMLFAKRTKELSAFWYATFCLFLTFRFLIIDDGYLYQQFPNQWKLLMFTEYVSLIFMLLAVIKFMYYAFTDLISKKFFQFASTFGYILLVSIILLPAYYYSIGLVFIQLYEVLLLTLFLVVSQKAIHYKKIGGKLFFSGGLFLFVTLVNDILLNAEIINSITLSPVGLFVFVFSQAGVLSLRFSGALKEVEQLTVKLEGKNEKLQSLNTLKDEFLANTSHELRTPLNGIIGIAESLVDGATGKLQTPTKQNLGMIISSGKRLAALVDDILDFSKLKNKELSIQEKALDLKSISDVVLNLSQPLVKGKKVKLSNTIAEDLPYVKGDENRVQQILHNLIGNSIKFTESGEIKIAAKQEGAAIQVDISDTGIGIPQNKLEDIFKSFEQVDASIERQYGGTGIGLSITKQLVELHGGKIWVSSIVHQGSTFSFTLPLSDKKVIDNPKTTIANFEKQEETSVKIPISSGNTKVLVVDDEPVNIQVLTNHLSLKDYSVLQAYNGREALEIIEAANKPDIVLLDVMMPKMSGYEVCEKIREKYPSSNLPVIMLTAKDRVVDVVKGFSNGANDYLTKPFHKDELLMRIQTHLSLAQINASYSRFFPAEFLQQLEQDNIINVKLGDHKQKLMSILFSDIRSFTSLSETMSSQDNFKFINSYLKRISPKVKKYNGFIDKYIGDAVMALYPNSPENAIDSAIEMLEELDVYNIHREQQGYQKISIGLGIHTGNLTLGIIGEQNRLEGTVISDAVNLASRLEGLTKKYATAIIISQETLDSIDKSKYSYRKLDTVKVKGKSKAVGVVEILNGSSQRFIDLKLASKADFEKGVELYQKQQFSRAIQNFTKVLQTDPDDKAAENYLEHCKRYKKHGVPTDWVGEETLDAK
ncbi:MAG: response regulator [Spirochaetota bacterium]